MSRLSNMVINNGIIDYSEKNRMHKENIMEYKLYSVISVVLFFQFLMF